MTVFRLKPSEFMLSNQIFIFCRVEPTKLTFIILGASMAGLSIMILVVSSLATGSTRHEVYRTSSGRTYGRIGKYTN